MSTHDAAAVARGRWQLHTLRLMSACARGRSPRCEALVALVYVCTVRVVTVLAAQPTAGHSLRLRSHREAAALEEAVALE